MSRIRLLDDALINRIAAGEVVERPASVVKELIENAFDAEAARVEIRVEAGGKRAIQVADDGHGMDRDDALLSIERHATSKLRAIEDLERIGSLGFRGEALASIAAVSQFRLRTAGADGAGTEIAVSGGRVEQVREVGVPRGTTVRVERLFFNVPARRKFLRADSTELSHVVRHVTRRALADPAIRIKLSSGNRTLIDVAAADDLPQRIAQLFGERFLETLLPFELERGSVRVYGLAGRPVEALSRRDAQHVFVNRRPIQDRVLAHAVSQAYQDAVPKGRFPALVLFVELRPADVDVNVHPQKTEVRFRESRTVHDVVRAAVASSFGEVAAVPTLGELRPAGAVGDEESPGSRARAAALRFLEVREPQGDLPGSARGASAPSHAGALVDEPEVPVALGQLRDSYIVAQDPEGLLLVDQHAAHERVLYERYLDDAEHERVERQRLMFPVTVEMSPEEHLLLERACGEFDRLGFDIEGFGGTTWRVGAVPAVAANVQPERLLRELLREAAESRSAAAGNAELRRKLITSAACQAAIKVNHRLTGDAIGGLLADLRRTRNPTTCPHGRPVSFRLTVEEIERAFRRR